MNELLLDALELDLERMLEGRSAPARHCARNAIRHLKKAWALADLDREMSVLRAIAAEEEAAGAVFHCLRAKKRAYPSASSLNARDHVQKFAFTALLDAIETFLAKTTMPANQLSIERVDGEERLRSRVKTRGPNGDEVWVYPVPPLHGSLRRNAGLVDFATEIREILDAGGFDSIKKRSLDRAKRRKLLLYSSHEGIPEVEGDISAFLTGQRSRVFRAIGVFLMIDPYASRQDLVDQALQAFLKMCGRLAGEMTTLAEAEEEALPDDSSDISSSPTVVIGLTSRTGTAATDDHREQSTPPKLM